MRQWIALALLPIFLLFTSHIEASATPDNLATIIQNVMPSIVSIQVEVKSNPYLSLEQKQKMPPDEKLGRLGSGVIFDADKGYLVTNAHVVVDAKTIQVRLSDSRVLTAELIGLDEPSDVAVLQIKADGLHALTFGDSDALHVGDSVVAVGSPFGLTQTVTSGIVSALQRDMLTNGTYDDFIQTDASINPGNSGGALITTGGSFIGINTAIISTEGGNLGIGFAIPSIIVKSIALQLIQYGKVERGLVGISAQNVTPDIASILKTPGTKGVLVAGVNLYSPADEAGLHIGDVITELNGTPVSSAGVLVAKMGLFRVGAHVTFTVFRHGDTDHLDIVLANPDAIKKIANKYNPYFNSLFLQNVSEKSPMQGNVQGVKIIALSRETNNASLAGLQVGDLILSANEEPTPTIKTLEAIAERNHQNPLLLNVLRGTQTTFFVLKPETN